LELFENGDSLVTWRLKRQDKQHAAYASAAPFQIEETASHVFAQMWQIVEMHDYHRRSSIVYTEELVMD
jgi:hypothetical protein